MKTIMPLLLVVMTNNNGIKGTHFQILYIGFSASKLRDSWWNECSNPFELHTVRILFDMLSFHRP